MSKAEEMVVNLVKNKPDYDRKIRTQGSTNFSVIDKNPCLAFDASLLDKAGSSSNDGVLQSVAGRFKFSKNAGTARSSTAIDLFSILFCFTAVHYMYLGSLDLTSHRSVILISALVVMTLSLYIGGSYNSKTPRNINKELSIVAISWFFSFTALGLFAFLTKTGQDISRVWLTLSMILVLVSLIGIRVASCLGFMTGRKAQARNIIVFGDAMGLDAVARNQPSLSNSSLQVADVVQFSPTHEEKDDCLSALRTSSNTLMKLVETHRQSGDAIEQVWISVSENQPLVVEEVSAALVNCSVDVCVLPDFHTQRLLNGRSTRYGDTDVVNISEISLPLAADQLKRLVDVCIASVAIFGLSLPMAIIAILIKLDSPGPALFRQTRYGMDGKEIEIYKFRSMRVHADSAAKQATRNDSRITRLGSFLRKSSLDELPQLFNVLQGQMSLVGPRPHAVAHNEVWRKQIPGYMLRHKVRPGITGWAQVNGWRGETDTVYKMQERVKFDLEYIREWSLWLDLKIIFMTVFVGFFHKNAY